LDQARNSREILQAVGDLGLSCRGEEETRDGGLASDPNPLKLRENLGCDVGKLLEPVLGGQRQAQVQKDERPLVGDLVLGKDLCRPPVEDLSGPMVLQGVVDVGAEPGAMGLDQLILLALEQRLSLGIDGERERWVTGVDEVPAERMDRCDGQVRPSQGVDLSHRPLGQADCPCGISTFASTEGPGNEAAALICEITRT
jgi:hypothetical protein